MPRGVIDKLDALLEEDLENLMLPLEQICQRVGLSRSQLHRILKEKTQLSLTLYLRQKKLEKAKSLLTNTDDLRVSEVAYLVGINSPQNFSKYFTDAFGLNPTEYRKEVLSRQETPRPAPTPQVSIAVLPFVNMSNDEEQEYFTDGVTEEIINVLSHVPNLKVAGRTSSFTFKGKNQDIRLIGEQLNVDHILEGSVRKSDQKLRITAQLINVKDGYHLWSERYDRTLKDIFDIQDELALAILKEIKIQLLGEDKETVLKRYTNNHSAYQLYLHGRYYHNKFDGADAFTKAIGYYQAAIDVEPTYAIAYAGMASCYLYMWFYRHLPSEQSLPSMKLATERALQLDDGIAESYLATARMQLLYAWDFERAAASFRKALEFSWNIGEVYGQYALYWSIRENHAKAEEMAALSLLEEPFSLINNYYAGYVYWAAGHFEQAIAQGQRLMALEPAFWGGHSIVGLNLITLKRYAEAALALQTALDLNYTGLTLSACGVLYGLSGEDAKARGIIGQLEALHQQQPVAHYDIGIVHAAAGDLTTACVYFEAAIENHEPPMLFFKSIVRDWLVGFEADERYKKLIARIFR